MWKYWPLFGGVLDSWFRDANGGLRGRREGLGEIPVLLQDNGDACGRRLLLEGVV
jgi:hypothetical protein